MANAEMTELWNGPNARAWVDAPDRYDTMLQEFGERVLDAAKLRPGEQVLDVGCGSGRLARDAAARVAPSGKVLGVDISAPLVQLAEQRSADVDNVEFVEADAQEHAFPQAAFDVVVSRFGVMFFEDPVRAFTNLHAATAPSGRLAFVCWQPALNNEWVMLAMGALIPHIGMPDLPPPGAPSPFAFADPDHVRHVLGSAGWADVSVDAVETTVPVGGARTPDDVVAYFRDDLMGRMFLSKAEPDTQRAALDALRAASAERMTDEGLRLGAACWLVTARHD